MRLSFFALIGFVFVLEIFYASGDEFLFGFNHNGAPVFWGKDQKLPEALEPDIKAANLTLLVAWLDMTEKVRENFLKMKERAKQCDTGMCDIGMPDYGMEEEDGMNAGFGNGFAALPPIPDMDKKIDEALERLQIYENRLLEELRKPEKDWNYSIESSTAQN